MRILGITIPEEKMSADLQKQFLQAAVTVSAQSLSAKEKIELVDTIVSLSHLELDQSFQDRLNKIIEYLTPQSPNK
jgi:hypothetical protein